MSEAVYTIRGNDPLLFRDGRPFTGDLGSLSAKTLPLPLPGTLAGMFRTRYGNVKRYSWTPDQADSVLKDVSVAGPLLLRDGEPVLPAPADAVVCPVDADGRVGVMGLRPLPSGQGCSIPDGMCPLAVTADVKPERGYHYWCWSDTMAWLANAGGREQDTPARIEGPPRDERTHVGICRQSQTASDGMLFSTEGICLGNHMQWDDHHEHLHATDWSLLARVYADDLPDLAGPASFGGERRTAILGASARPDWWQCPDAIANALTGSTRIRLTLATPALFHEGWKPTWLSEENGLTLKAAAVKRREPVSGWDYARKAPKPVRWLVPAGSVFFFECEGSATEIARKLWLAPVSDGAQERRDGYGLALWGAWDYAKD